jgi:integrase
MHTIMSLHRAPQLSVMDANTLLNQLPSAHAAIARLMLFTGMHWSEVMGKWEVLSDRVQIFGTKTEHRVRVVPLLASNLQHPTRASKAFRAALRAVRPDLSPYSFRRSFAHWMELAQIPRSRRKLYLGHSTGDTTGGYEVSEVEAFLADDAKRLLAFIRREQKAEANLSTLRQRDYDVL